MEAIEQSVLGQDVTELIKKHATDKERLITTDHKRITSGPQGLSVEEMEAI